MDGKDIAIPTTKSTRHPSLWLLALGALGIVYGDIGTSPLYAINEIFFGHGQLAVTHENVFGAIGLVVWILTFVVMFKYVVFVLLASHEGEGGVFALLGLLDGVEKKKKYLLVIMSLLVLAAGLLFGDGLITPAISVLSAVEGLKVATLTFEPYIIPITIAILTALFFFQYKGTKKVGIVFGPIMVVWFAVIAILGFNQIWAHPEIVYALNPVYAFYLLGSVGLRRLMLIIGAVMLTVTGGEALFADLGHFGLRPIRASWITLVYPALILNYLGQGAYLLSKGPIFEGNIFYSLVPSGLIYPMVLLAMCATVIASQALISGAYSLIAQAIALNFSPRFRIFHTNNEHQGQIYIPAINWMLYVGCICVVLAFKSSTNLASAYGLAEAGVMIVTSLSMFPISMIHWGWSGLKSSMVFSAFLVVDITFLISNSLKFLDGGYVPLSIGVFIFCIMSTWHWGRALITKTYDTYMKEKDMMWLIDLKQRLIKNGGVIVDKYGQLVELGRIVVFLVPKATLEVTDGVPTLIRAYMKQKGGIPKYVIMLNMFKEKTPYTTRNRYTIKNFGSYIFGVQARFGFMDDFNMQTVLNYLVKEIPLGFPVSRYAVEAGEEVLTKDHGLKLRKKLLVRFFRWVLQISTPTYRYFELGKDTSLSTTLIPIHVTTDGSYIKLPELDLVKER